MKSVQLRAFGKPTTAPELVETEAPEPGAGQVLVALEAAPINPSDLVLITGRYGHRLSSADVIFGDVRVRGFWLKHWLDATPRAEVAAASARLAALVADGTLRAPVEATYPLDRYRDALAHAAGSGRTGKVLFAW